MRVISPEKIALVSWLILLPSNLLPVWGGAYYDIDAGFPAE